MYKEELLNLASAWPLEQLNNYIEQLEVRQVDTRALIKELKRLRNRKFSGKTTPDNGPRDGR